MPEPEALAAAQAARREGEILVSQDEVSVAYDRMAATVSDRLAGENPLILCVMVGGLVPTAEIIRRLDFAFELDYLQVSRYRAQTVGGALSWRVSPAMPLAGRKVLVIDDVLDEGLTLAHIVAELAVQQPAELLTAVLVDKQVHGRQTTADIVGVKAPDRYLFGCGMDIHNYFRQLPFVAAKP